MRKIGDVIVDKISLLTEENTPAVQKASNSFAIVKKVDSVRQDAWAMLSKSFKQIADVIEKETSTK